MSEDRDDDARRKRPAFQFYPADWRKDVQLRACSLAARGLWVDLMCVMHECEPYGHLTLNGTPMTPAQIVNQIGGSEAQVRKLLQELLDNGVARTTPEGIVYSKRMREDERIRNARAEGGKAGSEHGHKGAEHGHKGGRPKTQKGGFETPLDAELKPPPSSSSSSSTSVEDTSLLTQAPARPPAEPPQLTLVAGQPKPAEPAFPDCPHLEILALWAEVLPALPQHDREQWRGARADHLRARWRETAAAKRWASRDEGIAYFRRLFAYVAQSPFLTGRTNPPPGKRPFVVELAWLVKPENWAKTIEGKYHGEAA